MAGITSSAAPAALMNGEQLLSFSTVAKKLPGYRANSHVNSATVWRWATKGVRLPDGQVVRLEAVRLGLAWKTSLEAVSRFSAALTAAAISSDDAPPAPTEPTPAARKRAADRAHQDLAEQLGG